MSQADKRPLEDEKSSESPCKRICTEFVRVKRKKVAMLLVYSGTGYYGMQKNPGMKTIEDDLLSAMHKANIITKENMDTPQTMRFQRAARTDKGVSAVGQIVSMKIPLLDNAIKWIHEYLPPCIRVIALKITTKGFNSKLSCDARTYSYMLPTFAFAPDDQVSEDYRITDSILSQVNQTLYLFKGTHHFHNFTSGKQPMEPSTQRYITEFECGQPFLRDDLEFVVISVKGQSFMLHQIRKMIGLTIAIIRNLTTTKTIQKAWLKETIDIPKAPSLGLVLEKVHFERYNKRYGDDGLHEPLEWDQYNDTIQTFKETFVYPPIVEGEKENKSMLKWLATVPLHTFDRRQPSEPSKAPPVFTFPQERISGNANNSEQISISVDSQTDSTLTDPLGDVAAAGSECTEESS